MLLPSSLVSSLSLSDLFTTIALELSLEPPTFSPSVMQIKFFPLQLHPQTCISKPIEVFRRTEGSTPQVRVTNLPSSISDILSRSLVSSNTLKCSFFLIKKMERLSPIWPNTYVFLKVSHNYWIYSIYSFIYIVKYIHKLLKFFKEFNTLLIKILAVFTEINVYKECDPAGLDQICFLKK